jgi:cytochrome c556
MQRSLSRMLAALAFVGATANATNVEDAIKYRHVVMEEMANHMAALELILFDKVDGARFAQGHADALARASVELENLFPPESRDGDTDALPVIWENPEEFSQAVAETREATAVLQSKMGGDDRPAAIAAFAATGKTCKACHESYRAEEHDEDDHEH